MHSIYHILNKVPKIYEDEIQLEYESLARQLVDSGRFRVDTDYYCNFVRYTDPYLKLNINCSYEELHDDELIELTKKEIKKIYTLKRRSIADIKLNQIIKELKRKSKKLLLVNDDLKMKLARTFVQSAHPIVIKWLIIDRVEVFITYSHSIGDVMDISNWKRSGQNSGMQSTDGINVCVYVSCGGDPFAENSEDHPMYGSGWAAIARLQVIAGQEIGHYADIVRDPQGNQLSRHSADFACTRAKPNVKQGRRNDIKRCKTLLSKLLNNGMDKIVEVEQKIKFYDENKINSLKVRFLRLIDRYYKYKLLQFALRNKLFFIKRFYDREKYMGLMVVAMIEDMQTHLTPLADVYKRSDPEAEEAISCVEALARVPQQVMKWGYLTTRATMHDLYKVYYEQVIPSLIDNYNKMTGDKYKRNYAKKEYNFFQLIINKIKNRKRFKFKEVRDI